MSSWRRARVKGAGGPAEARREGRPAPLGKRPAGGERREVVVCGVERVEARDDAGEERVLVPEVQESAAAPREAREVLQRGAPLRHEAGPRARAVETRREDLGARPEVVARAQALFGVPEEKAAVLEDLVRETSEERPHLARRPGIAPQPRGEREAAPAPRKSAGPRRKANAARPIPAPRSVWNRRFIRSTAARASSTWRPSGASPGTADTGPPPARALGSGDPSQRPERLEGAGLLRPSHAARASAARAVSPSRSAASRSHEEAREGSTSSAFLRADSAPAASPLRLRTEARSSQAGTKAGSRRTASSSSRTAWLGRGSSPRRR